MSNAQNPSSRKPIGEVGEDFVEWACHSPFGKDFLFRGQKYREGKDEIELCDLLLLLGDAAILMEVKTADRDKRPNRTDQDWADWAKARLAKALYQIARGVKAIRGGLVNSVENERQGRVPIAPASINRFYALAIVDHPELDKWGKSPTISIDDMKLTVLTTTHAELTDLLTELSTPGDLIDYLEARSAFFAKQMLMGNTELDLLAAYKVDPEQFLANIDKYDSINLGEDLWKEFAKLEARKRRDEMDRPSLFVDAIIDKLHEGRHAQLPHMDARHARAGQQPDPREAYVTIASELAKIRRIDRRLVGEGLIDKSLKCIEQKRDRWFANAPIGREGAVCVFLVSTDDREKRMGSLETVVWGAMFKLNAERVVGIATEPVTGGYGFSVDAFMVSGDPEEYRKQLPVDFVEELANQFPTVRRPEVTEFGGHSQAQACNFDPRFSTAPKSSRDRSRFKSRSRKSR